LATSAPAPHGGSRTLRRLRLEELFYLVYGLLLFGLLWYAGQAPVTLADAVAGPAIPLLIGGVVVASSVSALRREAGAVRFDPSRLGAAARTAGGALRVLIPVGTCGAFYLALHDLTPRLRPQVVDGTMVAIDRAVFGVDVSRWLDDHFSSPIMTQVMSICYVSYLIAPPLYALYLWRRAGARTRQYRDFSMSVAIIAVLGYSGYVLVPVVGPHLYQASLYPDRLPGTGALLDGFTQFQGTARDGFPSLHTAMTMVLLASMWRDARRLFWLYLPIGLGLFASTLYLRRHYAIDVVAGFVTAAVALAVAPRVNRWWYGADRPAGPATSRPEATRAAEDHRWQPVGDQARSVGDQAISPSERPVAGR
jgi:membrane-associated phospholipid phosphatase